MWHTSTKLVSFQEMFLGKKFVCCTLNVLYSIHITGIIEIVINKYFVLKSTWACPNSNYLLSSVASKDTTTC